MATHEFGHWLKLLDLYGDADDLKTMYYKNTSYGETLKRSLTSDDIDGAQYIYPGEAPTVTTNAASSIATRSATLNGNLTSKGTDGTVDVSFVWGTTQGGPYPNATTPQSKTTTGSFSFNLANLSPDTDYYYKAKAVGHGTVYGVERHFTTDSPSSPSVHSSSASNIETTAATLNGSLEDLGSATSVDVSFEYGLTTDYGNNTLPEAMASSGDFDTGISNLSPNTTYHFRSKAVGDGTDYGGDQEFTTATTGTPPSVTTNAASDISTTTVTLNGNLTSLGTASSVDVSFEWGLTTSYGNTTTPQSKSSTGSFNAPLTDLSPDTTYHFRAKAVGDGTSYGGDQEFTTTNTAAFGLDSGNYTWAHRADVLDLQRFPNTAGTGTLTQLDLRFWDGTPNGKVRMGVYADNDGVPGSLLLDAGEVPAVDVWVTISGLNLPVTSGSYYWLGYTMDSNNDVRYQTGQPTNSHVWGASAYGTLPATFPTIGLFVA